MRYGPLINVHLAWFVSLIVIATLLIAENRNQLRVHRDGQLYVPLIGNFRDASHAGREKAA